jgi:hypothetical protein
MVTLISGLVGGLVATIVMTVFMMVLGDDSPPPTAAFWAKYVGDGEASDFMMQGMVLHLLYGIVGGGVFVSLLAPLGLGVTALTGALLWGIVYGIVLFVFAAGFWMMVVLDMSATPAMAAMFLLFHLVYGAVLGGFVFYLPTL